MFFECFNQPFLVFLWYCISLTLCQRTTNSQKCPKLMLHATIFNDSQYKWSNQKFGWFNCRLRNAFLWVNICVHNNLIELTFFSNWTLLSCAQTKMSFVFFNVLCILIEFKSLGFCGTSLDVKNFLKGEHKFWICQRSQDYCPNRKVKKTPFLNYINHRSENYLTFFIGHIRRFLWLSGFWSTLMGCWKKNSKNVSRSVSVFTHSPLVPRSFPAHSPFPSLPRYLLLSRFPVLKTAFTKGKVDISCRISISKESLHSRAWNICLNAGRQANYRLL